MSEAQLCLVDSNVLIYMHDSIRLDHQRPAIDVYERLVESNRVALSTQCLTEFINGVTRKIRNPLPTVDAFRLLDRIANAGVVHPVTLDIVRDATAAAAIYQMSIWDALIWSVAFRNGIPVIVTEYMQSQRVIAGVRYVNPFDPDFDLDSL